MHAAIMKSGPVDLNDALVQVLQEGGVEEAVVVGSAIGDHLLEAPRPDFVVGILTPVDHFREGPVAPYPARGTAFNDLDVMVRIGMTIERGIPAFLIVPPPLTPPNGLRSLVIAACAPDDLETLRLHLWAFIATLSDRPKEEQSIVEIKLSDTIRLLKALRRSGQAATTGFEIEKLVVETFRQAGAELAVNPDRARDQGFDLAVLPSRLSDDVILVEVKAGNLTERTLRETEGRLQQAVIDRHGSLGLLIYHDTNGRRFPAQQPTVPSVRIALEDLLERLAHETLPRVLAEAVSTAAERM